MAVLSPYRLPFPPNLHFRRRTQCRCSITLPSNGGARARSAAVLWFKQDLRIDDHPGLVEAAKFNALVPLYVFDRRILSRFDDEMLEMALFALEDLRKSLKERGSNLMVRFGGAESVIGNIVQQFKVTNVFAEEEVEYHLRQILDIVEETVEQSALLDEKLKIVRWQTPFYDIKDLKDLPDSYADFTKLQLGITSPVLLPALPSADLKLDWGSLPSMDDVKKFMNHHTNVKLKENWSLVEMSTASILRKKLSETRETNNNGMNFKQARKKRPQKSVFVTQSGKIVGGGTDSVLNGLAAYLRNLEGTARDDWQEVHERLRNAESREGASFFALFGPALCLGIISRRRVHFEAIKYEKERNAGFLSPFGYSTATVAAAADAVCSVEWYWLMALKSLNDEVAFSIRIWRWKGHLVQYTVDGEKGPAVLLVHGFGAFLEHYRDNIDGISECGNQVWAITILGFGKSEKPNIVYTELLWAELLRDFIIEVVGEPVHLIGNSIGGYLVAIVACFWPALAKSVILVNTAGDIIPGYGYLQFSRERQTSGAAWLGARLLLFYLRLNIRSIVKSCYPTAAERADDWLIHKMLRASSDPGVLVVLESIFGFNLSLPLNFLLEDSKEKTLIIQGMKDPISDSKSKVAMLKDHCSGIVIRELDAGHCPHDEKPQEVNAIIREWIVTVESKVLQRSFL
ncbi:hypothetical protein K2173_008641 [Erythroxylum novogranatense]|uniref:Photolyase/cryptochrome alpha/beta domain-containing protein n=1 Tax=Erythroxylum novogranatense TaxID=1862640 RepID=A0AAV8SKV4_9ROSI|nr:hypothetical protein K2173_008641 [Erythroxylum novogranatense]